MNTTAADTTADTTAVAIDSETMGWLRERIGRTLKMQEEYAEVKRKALDLAERELARVKALADLDDHGFARHHAGADAPMRPVLELVLAMGGVAGIRRILRPVSVRITPDEAYEACSVASLRIDFDSPVRCGGNLCRCLYVTPEKSGSLSVGGETFASVAEAVARIEEMFGVSFSRGEARITTPPHLAGVVLPPELKRYENVIREAINKALPVSSGLAVVVRTKAPTSKKTPASKKTPTTGESVD